MTLERLRILCQKDQRRARIREGVGARFSENFLERNETMVPFSELLEAVTPFLREVTEALPQAPDVQATLSQEALSHPPIPAPERIEIPSPAISQTDLWDLVNEQPGVGWCLFSFPPLRRKGTADWWRELLSNLFAAPLRVQGKGRPALPNDNLFFEKAQSIFDRKGQILFKMEELEPGRGWLAK